MMNNKKLISKNIILRFKEGGYIRKLLYGSFVLQNPVVKDFGDLYLEKSKKEVEENNRKIELRRKAINRANKNTKAPLAANNIAQLQDNLWKIGAFNGLKDRRGRDIIYETAVDGIEGSITNAAIANAKKLGYNVDRNSGTVSNSNNLSSTTQTSSSLEPWLEKAIRGSVSVPGEWIERQRLFDNENKLKQGKNIRFGSLPISSFDNDNVGNTVMKAYDNMYPYSYGDMLLGGSGDMIPYSRYNYENGLPGGYRLTLTTADIPKDVLVRSMRYKFSDAIRGKDPRRAFMEELASYDLNTAEGMRLYREALKRKPEGFVRANGNPVNDQFEMRARHDLAYAYGHNGELPYGTFELNPDYDSPTAKANGRATYRIKDPKQRERIYGEMINYFLNHSKEGYWNKDHTAYILPHMGYLGNQSLISDDEQGTNLRYGDWWDYVYNPSNSYVMYMGDRLVPEGKSARDYRYGNGLVGHNSKHMTEVFDGDYAKEMLKDILFN